MQLLQSQSQPQPDDHPSLPCRSQPPLEWYIIVAQEEPELLSSPTSFAPFGNVAYLTATACAVGWQPGSCWLIAWAVASVLLLRRRCMLPCLQQCYCKRHGAREAVLCCVYLRKEALRAAPCLLDLLRARWYPVSSLPGWGTYERQREQRLASFHARSVYCQSSSKATAQLASTSAGPPGCCVQ
jgi:hypothetical protein